jgi:deoxyribose-phosphate aldolase
MSSITSQDIERIIARVISEKNLSVPGNIAPFSLEAANDLISFGASRIGTTGPACPPKCELAHWIDHTILKTETTKEEIERVCKEAKELEFASVCLNPTWVPLAYKLLRGSRVRVCTVVGFPLGATYPETKALETKLAIENGAQEIDMVINVGALKSGDYELVEHDIRSVVRAASRQIVKVIIETCLLTEEEKVKACTIAKHAGANFVKTSTGFSSGGATVQDVALMRQVVGSEMGVKASGGVHNYEEACKMVQAGATRIGASASVAIVSNGNASAGDY